MQLIIDINEEEMSPEILGAIGAVYKIDIEGLGVEEAVNTLAERLKTQILGQAKNYLTTMAGYQAQIEARAQLD